MRNANDIAMPSQHAVMSSKIERYALKNTPRISMFNLERMFLASTLCIKTVCSLTCIPSKKVYRASITGCRASTTCTQRRRLECCNPMVCSMQAATLEVVMQPACSCCNPLRCCQENTPTMVVETCLQAVCRVLQPPKSDQYWKFYCSLHAPRVWQWLYKTFS